MEYITIKDKEHANLRAIADKLDELRIGGVHEVLAQVQGNTEDIY